MDRPNLFSDATESLQEAFVCWLLKWALPQYGQQDAALHECAVRFIRALFAKHKKEPPPEFQKIQVDKQAKKIDLLCIINNRYAILIEDKTGTNERSNPLRRYVEIVKQDFEIERSNILPIYLKTEDQADYSKVKEAGYQLFLREDFLKILRLYSGSNPILEDYRCHLQSISVAAHLMRRRNEVDAWKSKPPEDWTWYQWVGFYMELQSRLDLTDKDCWGYVHRGDFLAFFWHFLSPPHSPPEGIYLQLEQEKEKLCFKIEVGEQDNDAGERLWNEWHEKIMAKGRKHGLDLKKPKFKNGTTMTVCVYNGDYRVCNKNGLINLDQTVAIWKKAEKVLDAATE